MQIDHFSSTGRRRDRATVVRWLKQPGDAVCRRRCAGGIGDRGRVGAPRGTQPGMLARARRSARPNGAALARSWLTSRRPARRSPQSKPEKTVRRQAFRRPGLRQGHADPDAAGRQHDGRRHPRVVEGERRRPHQGRSDDLRDRDRQGDDGIRIARRRPTCRGSSPRSASRSPSRSRSPCWPTTMPTPMPISPAGDSGSDCARPIGRRRCRLFGQGRGRCTCSTRRQRHLTRHGRRTRQSLARGAQDRRRARHRPCVARRGQRSGRANPLDRRREGKGRGNRVGRRTTEFAGPCRRCGGRSASTCSSRSRPSRTSTCG